MRQITHADSTVNLFEAPLNGMRKGLRQFEKSSQRLAKGGVAPEAIVSQLEADLIFRANAASMRAADEMIGVLFDERA